MGKWSVDHNKLGTTPSIICGRRVCKGPCGRWRHILDFPPRKNRRGEYTSVFSRCHVCGNAAKKERNKVNPQRAADMSRTRARRERRLAGIPERGPRVVTKPTRRDVVPRLPFAQFLAELREKHGMTKTAQMVGMGERRIAAIIYGYSLCSRRKTPARVQWEIEVYGKPLKRTSRRRLYPIDWIEFDTVDRALVHYGEPWLLDELYPIGDDA